MTISTILLISAEGDPHGLLREGPCGARPPVMSKWEALFPGVPPERTGCRFWADDPTGTAWASVELRSGLVLANEGKLVVEGCDRWWRVGRALYGTRWPWRHPSGWMLSVPEAVHHARHAVELAARGYIEPHTVPGTWIFLDADGREVTP